MNSFDVLLTGSYYCDLIFTGITELPALGSEIYAKGMELVPGGGAINTMVALQHLGINAGWVGVFGSDFASRLVADWLLDNGYDLSLVERRSTPYRRLTVAMSYPYDRAFVTYNDPRIDTLPLLEKAVEQGNPRLVHFPGLTIDPRLPPLLERWRARGIFVSMDCQHRPHTLDSPLVCDTLKQVDIFMPNASEAMRLTETATLHDAATTLARHVSRIVVKDGVHGSWLFEGSNVLHAPALAVTPIDTTGAGDVFNAGFLAAHLAGYDGMGCLRQGNVCGGLSTLGYGGSLSAPRKDVVTEALTHYGDER